MMDLPMSGHAVLTQVADAGGGILSAAGAWVEGLGAWAFLAAPSLMIVVSILPIPAEIPAMVNGMTFGPLVGTLVTWSGALVGALLSFELSRRYGRPLAGRVLPRGALEWADRFALSAGAPGLLVARLTPVVAFTAINWLAGLTPIGRRTFAWTTAVGILPGAIAFPFREVAYACSTAAPPSPPRWSQDSS